MGNTVAAVERYTRFIGISPSYHHREIARAEIRRLSGPAALAGAFRAPAQSPPS